MFSLYIQMLLKCEKSGQVAEMFMRSVWINGSRSEIPSSCLYVVKFSYFKRSITILSFNKKVRLFFQ